MSISAKTEASPRLITLAVVGSLCMYFYACIYVFVRSLCLFVCFVSKGILSHCKDLQHLSASFFLPKKNIKNRLSITNLDRHSKLRKCMQIVYKTLLRFVFLRFVFVFFLFSFFFPFFFPFFFF